MHTMASTQSASPTVPRNQSHRYPHSTEEETKCSILSPKFLSAAAMAGWDEEALLIATLVVEDTPVRESQLRKRRSKDLQSPSTTCSTRKRRSKRRSADAIPSLVLCLDDNGDTSSCQGKRDNEGEGALAKKEEFSSPQEADVNEKKTDSIAFNEEKKGEQREGDSADKENLSSHQESELKEKISNKVILIEDERSEGKDGSLAAMFSGKHLPCLDQLREELSCAICLEICYEPSTTPCGHSFCKKCLKRAAERCGKTCPKCRQVISCGRPCSVNTVLWNTIQLLFPEEVEARKKAMAASVASSRRKASIRNLESRRTHRDTRSRRLNSGSSSISSTSRSNSFRSAMEVLGAEESHRNSGRRTGPSQDEDAALALRLQREEFLEAFRTSSGEQRDPIYSSARARLRAMASAAYGIRSRSYGA